MPYFEFDPEKALEALVYVVGRVPQGDMYKALKVLYIADKLHLGRYGRFIYGESYAALPHGPVPQNAYDAVRVLSGERARSAFSESLLREAIERSGNRLIARRAPDIDALSRSDAECLDEAIRDVEYDPFPVLKQKTHDSAYHATAANALIDLEAIIGALPEDRQESVRRYLAL